MVTIRTARPHEAEDVEHVRVTTWKTAYQGLISQDYLDDLDVDEAIARARFTKLAQTGGGCLVAVDDGTVVGFTSFGPSRDADVPGGEVYALYVLPTYWDAGAGRALMAAAAQALKDAGWDGLSVWVLEGNTRARRFYERFGMRFTGARKRFEPLKPAPTEMLYAMP